MVINAFPPCLFGFTITYGAIWFLCGTPKAFWQAHTRRGLGFFLFEPFYYISFLETLLKKRAAVSTCHTNQAVTSVDVVGQHWENPPSPTSLGAHGGSDCTLHGGSVAGGERQMLLVPSASEVIMWPGI